MKSFKKSFSLNCTKGQSVEQQKLVIQQQANLIETQQSRIYKLETKLETLSKFPVSDSPKCSSSRLSKEIGY